MEHFACPHPHSIHRALSSALAFAAVLAAPRAAHAVDCSFTSSGTTMILRASCTTGASIVIPDGFTVDGGYRTITAVDPPGGHFKGAILVNGGATANVRRIRLTAHVADVCDTGDDKLRGIALLGASGRIEDVEIDDVNQGPATTCDEGAGVIVNNLASGGPATNVNLLNVRVTGFAKVGVQLAGKVVGSVTNSAFTGASSAAIAVNSAFAIVVASGAKGTFTNILTSHQPWSPGQRDTYGFFVQNANGSMLSNSVVSGGHFGAYVDSVCGPGFGDTAESSDNQIVNTVIKDAHDGVTVVAFSDGTCLARADRNVVSRGFVQTTHGETGIFVDAIPSHPPAEADANSITGNAVLGFTTPVYVGPGATNTVVSDNVLH